MGLRTMINKTEKEIMQNWGKYEKPVVSISCTAYNHGKYIKRCMDGFLMQKTNFPFEIVVHDDASTDNTLDILREYKKKYPNIINLLEEKENQYSKHDGTILRLMNNEYRGDYIALCEGDDFWICSDKLQLQYDALICHPDCVAAFHKVQFVDEYEKEVDRTAPSYDSRINGLITLEDFCKEEFGRCRWTFHMSSYFFSKKISRAYLSNWLKNETNFCGLPYGDLARVLFMLMKGKGIYIDKILGCYREFSSGSYNDRIRKNSDFAIQQDKKLIKGLNRFDCLTLKKYHSYIKCRILKADFNIKYRRGDLFGMLNPKYGHSIKFAERYKFILKTAFPKSYYRLKSLYYKLKRK